MTRQAQATRSFRPSGSLFALAAAATRARTFRTWQVSLLFGLALVLSTIPAGSLAQSGAILRILDRPSLLDDGDADSLRTAIARSLGWLDRQPPGRAMIFGSRRVTISEYAAGLRRLLMLLANDPPAELLEERVHAEFEVLASTGRVDGAVLLTGYHEPVVEVSDRQRPDYPFPCSACRRTSPADGGTRAI